MSVRKPSHPKDASQQKGSNMPKPMSESRGSYIPSPSAVKFSQPSSKPSTKVSKKS
ncbi:MAG: hypothetical protein O2827_03080 [Verrucomicrobia bacterium]|nr:hypothetical protein [Verrucomicrobiota bacterium]